MPGSGAFGWLYPGDYYPLAAAQQELARSATLPVEFGGVAPEILFLNWLAAGGGAPIWWRRDTSSIALDLTPRTPAEHLHPRRRRRRSIIISRARLVEPPRVTESCRRLYRRRVLHSVLALPRVRAERNLIESDEEFLILTGSI